MVQRKLPKIVAHVQMVGKDTANYVSSIMILMATFPRGHKNRRGLFSIHYGAQKRGGSLHQITGQESVRYALLRTEEADAIDWHSKSSQNPLSLPLPTVDRLPAKAAVSQIETFHVPTGYDFTPDYFVTAKFIIRVGKDKN
jgi:hypothetical protein